MKDINAGTLTHCHGSVRPPSNRCHSLYLMNSWQVWRGRLTADVFFVLIHQPRCTELGPSSWKELTWHTSKRRSSIKDKMWNPIRFFSNCYIQKRCSLIWCSVCHSLRLKAKLWMNTVVDYLRKWSLDISWIDCGDTTTEMKNGFLEQISFPNKC